MASSATRAAAKWQKKAGKVAKTYKLDQKLVEQFAAACALVGRSQAAVLDEILRAWIKNPHAPQGVSSRLARSASILPLPGRTAVSRRFRGLSAQMARLVPPLISRFF